MSYDLAVWQGIVPETDADAAAIYGRLMERMHSTPREEPTSAIRAFVDALLARWPDLNQPDGDDSPWTSAPLIDEASGDAIYFGMVWSQAEQASEFAVHVAADHGLVCFDPQAEQLRRPRD